MLIGLISDIHGNTRAMAKAMDLLKKQGAEKIICLGDLTGYGKDPSGVMEMAAAYVDFCIMGNHDHAVCCSSDLSFFNARARKYIIKHRQILGEQGLKWLSELPLTAQYENCTFVHASLPEPDQWKYPARNTSYMVFEEYIHPDTIFNAMETDFLFCGHTHNPGIIAKMKNGETRVFPSPQNKWTQLQQAEKVIIDTGSISMPRNKELGKSCVLFNTDNNHFRFLFLT